MDIRELRTDAAILHAFPLMKVLRDRISQPTFVDEIRRQQRVGYRLFGGFEQEDLLVLAGVRHTHTLSRGDHVFIDDLVTADAVRGSGHGREMMRWLAHHAASEGIPRIYLDARITAKGFYEKLGFVFHTSIPCWIDVDRLLI
jgi:ribosomal protein S18 acetylase RimI-like enzyme